MKILRSLFIVCFLLLLGLSSAESPALAKIVPVGDSAGKPAPISLVSTSDVQSHNETPEPVHLTQQTEEKKAAPAAPAAKEQEKAAPQAAAAPKASSSSDAEVALSTESTVSDSSMLAQEVAHANENGWTWGCEGIAEKKVSEITKKMSARQKRRAWMQLRFRTACPKVGGDECRRTRRARYRLYLRARREYMKAKWSEFGNQVKRKCKGPWVTRCPVGDEGRLCRKQRRKWRKKCRSGAFSRRRRSCRGPWTRRCPKGSDPTSRACRKTRKNWRKQCRIRRGLRRRSKKYSLAGKSRFAIFRARLLASRSSYLVRHKRVKLIYIGRNKVLEFRPTTGYFQIFKVKRRSMDRVSSRPTWRKEERVVWGRWAKLARPYRLTYIGRNRILAHNRRNGKYRIFKISADVTGNANPLTLQASGKWRRARRRSIVYLGKGRLVTFRRKSGRYTVWKVSRKKTGENTRVFSVVTKSASWVFSRRGARYVYLGRNTLLQWHKKSYRMLNFNRDAKLKQAAFRYIKGGALATAFKRKWPLRSGHPGVGVVYLGGKLLVFYRTKSSTKTSTQGAKLYRLSLYPFRIIRINNPRYTAVNPANLNQPWLNDKDWEKNPAFKPWLTNPKYCVRYDGWAPSGKVYFSGQKKIRKLPGAAGNGNRIIRVGRSLLDYSPATGSYRVLKYNKARGAFVQKSFGVFPDFKAGWRLIALSGRRLLNYHPVSRKFMLYPFQKFQIRRPIATGNLKYVPRGFRLVKIGKTELLAWNPRNGQWRVFRINSDITGAAVSVTRRMIAGGQWCDIKKGTTLLSIGGRNLMALNKATGSYTLYRFGRWARGKRANVFKKVLARGTFADPFLATGTRLLALRNSRILGWQPSKNGILYTTWFVGYTAGKGRAASRRLGSLGSELSKFIGLVSNMKRYLQLNRRKKNVDPAMLLQKPTFAGMNYRDFKDLFGAYLGNVKVKFPWKSTLSYFKNQVTRRAMGLSTDRPERSDGARRANVYSVPKRNGNPGGEQQPRMRTDRAAAARNDQPVARTTGSSKIPTGAALQNSPARENDIWPDGDKMPDDVFDDGTGPVPGSQASKPASAALGRPDVLVSFPQEWDMGAPVDEVPLPTGMDFEGKLSAPENIDDADHSEEFVDDAMSVGDSTSQGLTSLERSIPELESDGPSRREASQNGLFEHAEKRDPVGDEEAVTRTVYPKNTRDYVGRRDSLKGMIVPGDGEPPLDVIH